MENKKTYLTIHGHFYQPPRENPWIEAIEIQESACPFHDWNSRIANECYIPNSVAKIVDYKNQILDIVNNYSKMSFNFGPTLLSWLELYEPYTYERIIKADVESAYKNNGHGNAIAQTYNHIIMPLANKKDKYTQTIWGIKDFKCRFGRAPEGMWLSEAAVDDETLEVLIDCGIKFTVLSPYQAQKIKKFKDTEWTDVSWGTIDPAKPYRYFTKNDPEKYIDIFFYDGSISKSVAFDNILKDGNNFVSRLKEGICGTRDYNQIINIATDGESYGHHTKFGDMALSYILRIRAEEEGFTITNYANYLHSETVDYEVEIKPVSSWSCAHGVERWQSDCGCSGGGAPGWNQKWRKPLREAIDYLRDEIAVIFESNAKKYYNYCWDARNDYINVILDRSEENIKKFFDKHLIDTNMDHQDKVNALKLMEIQRQAMLMYTSCGWFFSEISGIETTQIMKYAARAIQLISDFSDKDLESNFLNILSKAQSNITHFGTGKDVYEKFVKPAVITTKEIATLWAVSSLYQDFEKDVTLYCFDINKHNYKKFSKGGTNLVIGRIEIKSRITLEKTDLIFALLQYPGGDFHCAIREFSNQNEYAKISKNLIDAYANMSITETIRQLDENFGTEYFSLKDIFSDERTKILSILLKDKLSKFSNVYREIYNEGKGSILQLKDLGLYIPEEFKLAAQYTLSQDFNKLFTGENITINEDIMQIAAEIIDETKALSLELDKKATSKFFSEKICHKVIDFAKTFEQQRLDKALELFEYIDELEICVDISEAQNIYFNRIFDKFSELLDETSTSLNLSEDRSFLLSVLKLGDHLNINTEFYKSAVIKATSKSRSEVTSN